jgi:hypothetical protein
MKEHLASHGEIKINSRPKLFSEYNILTSSILRKREVFEVAM